MDELSKNNPPVSNCIVIDAKDKISETKQKQNDGYNKKAVFDMFDSYVFREGKYVMLKDPIFDEFEEKDEKYIKLKDVDSHLFMLKTKHIKQRKILNHYLVSSNSIFKQSINKKHKLRLFTFIEYNEDYIHKHVKNYVFNCDQIASVLLPYISEQLSFEIRIKLTNFVKIVVLHKLTNEGITNEHRFLIIYDDHGILRRYLVDNEIKFNTNVKFNFMEENLFCKSLSEFEIIDEIIEDTITKEQKQIKHPFVKVFDNHFNDALYYYMIKIIHSFYNDDEYNKPETFILESNKSKIEFNFDFDFNEVINSENINELFDYLRVFNRFNIVNNIIIRTIDSKIYEIHQNDYKDKIMSHFVKDFSDETLSKLNLKTLSCLIKPDTIIVTY